MAGNRIFTIEEVETLIGHDDAGDEERRSPAGELLEKLLN